ncbi:ribonuclease III domain-containing protein [Pyronema omphalodes]|nr:ribonuclease III domain-containing protein [Pyronema omphalodes]
MLLPKFLIRPRIPHGYPPLLFPAAYGAITKQYSTATSALHIIPPAKPPFSSSCQELEFDHHYIPSIPDTKIDLSNIKHFQFANKLLEEEVFTHSSWGMNRTLWFSSEGNQRRLDNDHLEFLGDSVLKGLTARMLDDMFPELTAGQMTTLQEALVNNEFYAYICRQLGLIQRLKVHGEHDKCATTRICAGLFEAYVGGMHKELGLKGYPQLYEWFESIMKPYAIAFKERLEEVAAAKIETGSSRVLPTLAKMKINPSWVNWLHLYAAKNSLNVPEFEYEGTAAGSVNCPLVTAGDMSQFWTCTVEIEGFTFESGMKRSKASAKDAVCYEIYKFVMRKQGLDPEGEDYWAEVIASGECKTVGDNKDDETIAVDTRTADATVTDRTNYIH